MNVLYDANMNVQAPTDVQSRLAAIDPKLSLRYVKYPNAGSDRNHWWALVSAWPENDKRRVMIFRGDMPEEYAFDVLGYLPLDMPSGESLNECFDAIVTILRKQEKHPHVAAKNYLERVANFNNQVKKANLTPVTEHAEEIIEANVKTMFKEQGKDIPKVFVNDARPETKARKPSVE